MQIVKSETFKKEQARITKFLSEDKDEHAKQHVKKLFNELMSNVRTLDQMHGDIINIGKLGDGSQELRSKIVDIRKQIDKIISKS